VKFGVELPTCTAGMAYPVPFASGQDVVRIAVEAEQLGYDEVAGNDHLSTMNYVRRAWPDPPDYFEPLITHAYIAARTSTVRLMTGILVLPLREPVLLAKQVATLDRLSGGRLVLGVAVGGYREEFDAVLPDRSGISRAALVHEQIEALRTLFEDRRSTYRGAHVHFEDVELHPKPLQRPFPIYSGGNSEGSIRRAAELCDGWLPAHLGPEAIRRGRERLALDAEKSGRDPASIATAVQLNVCLGRTAGEAHERFRRSQFGRWHASLAGSMQKGVDLDSYEDLNLVGTPDDIRRRVAALEAAGVEALSATMFVGNTVDEMLDQIRAFARTVMPAFR
jgi:probable F420-dependent oxidoreductase